MNMNDVFWDIVTSVRLKSEEALCGAVTLHARHEYDTDELVYKVTHFGQVVARDQIEVRIATRHFFKVPADKLVLRVVAGLRGVMQKDAELQSEKNRWIADILAAPQEWDRFYIFADWLDDQGLELEAEQWRYRGQYFGQWIEADIDSEKVIKNVLWRSVHEKGFLFASTHIEDECWCKKKGLRYVPKWPVTLEDVRKGRDEQ